MQHQDTIDQLHNLTISEGPSLLTAPFDGETGLSLYVGGRVRNPSDDIQIMSISSDSPMTPFAYSDDEDPSNWTLAQYKQKYTELQMKKRILADKTRELELRNQKLQARLTDCKEQIDVLASFWSYSPSIAGIMELLPDGDVRLIMTNEAARIYFGGQESVGKKFGAELGRKRHRIKFMREFFETRIREGRPGVTEWDTDPQRMQSGPNLVHASTAGMMNKSLYWSMCAWPMANLNVGTIARFEKQLYGEEPDAPSIPRGRPPITNNPCVGFVMSDITDLKLGALRLARAEERLRLAQEAVGDGLFEWYLPSMGPPITATSSASSMGSSKGGFKSSPEGLPLGLLPDGNPSTEPLSPSVLAREVVTSPEPAPLNHSPQSQSSGSKSGSRSSPTVKPSADSAAEYVGYLYVSATLAQMLEYDGPQQISASNWLEHVHPDDLEMAREAYAPKDDHDEIGCEYRCLTRKTKTIKWILMRGRVLERGVNGEPRRIVGILSDIDRKRETENKLRMSEARMRDVISLMPFTLVEMDATGQVHHISPYYAKMTGLEDMGEAVGTGWTKYIHKDDLPWVGVKWSNFVKGTEKLNDLYFGVFRQWRADDPTKMLWIEARAVRTVNPITGETTGYLATLNDVTELKAALEKAEIASKAKSDFVFSMSHELRTPVNGVLSGLELISATNVSDEQMEYLEIVKTSGESLLGIINDVLDFSRVEAGKMVLDIGPFALAESIKRRLKPFEQKATQSNLEFHIHFEPHLPQTVWGDSPRLNQIIVNLVSNALKFCSQGSVVVEVRRWTGEVDQQQLDQMEKPEQDLVPCVLEFVVSDTGIGVAPEYVSKIFDAFTQADMSISRSYGGTGLGLAISKRLVDLMGGKIWVESVLGQGSQFHFTARIMEKETSKSEYFDLSVNTNSVVTSPSTPFKATTPERTVFKETSLPKTSRRILLAEDNLINQKLAIRILEKAGFNVTVAGTGMEAVNLFKGTVAGGGSGVNYDLVLMDIGLPEMSGIEASQTIREVEQEVANGELYQPIPIVALTAHVLEKNKRDCLDAGMQEVLTKPIQTKVLFQTIDKLVSERV